MDGRKQVNAPTIILICVLIIMAVIILLKVILPVTLVQLQQRSVRKELNNPIINSKFDGWEKKQLDNVSTISVPESWSIKKDESSLGIYSGETQIARGVQMPGDIDVFHGNDEFAAYQEKSDAFAASLVDYPVKKIVYNDITALHLGTGARYMEATFYSEEDESTTYLMLLLPQGKEHDFIFLFENESDSHKTMLQQIEAIAYSYNG